MADNDPKTVYIERRSGGGLMAIVALVALIVIAALAYTYIESNNNKNDAISTAAGKVGDAAQDVGQSAKDATDQ